MTNTTCMTHQRCALLLGALLLGACPGAHRATPTIYEPSNPAEKAPAAPAPPALAVITNLQGPESVLYDPEQDVYFISNINGELTGADNNGFISRVNASTMQTDLKWIESGKNGAHLDAPRGLAIAGDTLYVADISGVFRFDRRTGAPRGVVRLPGATLINDLTSDGRDVYASDTGIVPGSGITFVATNTDAIWKISGDSATRIASGTDLDQPNGIDFYKGQLWAVSFKGNQLYRVDGGKKKDVITLPRGQLDGLVHLPDGSPVVASWFGNAVYRGVGGGKFTPLLKSIAAPADIGYDSRHKRLLVPRTTDNEVTVHSVS